MRRIFWITILCIACFSTGGILGLLTPRLTPSSSIINEEIHLKIPKTSQDLKKQLLHISAQKAMLEECIKWEEKEKRGEIKK